MHSVYDIAHTRDAALRRSVPEEVVARYSNSLEVERLADMFDDDIMAAARKGHPAIAISVEDVAAAMARLDGKDGYAEGAIFVTIKLVDWLRRNTLFHFVSYTGNGADFVIQF